MGRDIQSEVFATVAEFTGVPYDELKPETTLFYDLGIDGDAAAEFFQDFQTRFHVDLTGFRFGDHFGPEKGALLIGLFNWVKGWWIKDHHRAAGMTPIYLRDLVNAAQSGKWVNT